MAVEKFYDAGIFYNGLNLTGQSNQVSVEHGVNILDTSVFGVGTHIYAAGNDEWNANVAGFWNAGANEPIDPGLWDRGGEQGAPLLVYPKNEDVGVCYMFPAVLGTLNFFGTFGELAPFDASFHFGDYGAAGAVRQPARGVIGIQPSALTGGTGSGTYSQLGALSSSQYLVFCVHLLSTDATTVAFELASDDNSGFSSETQRIDGGALAEYGSFYGHLQGPITDDYFRVNYTRTGGTTFTAVAGFGIASPS